MLAHHKLADLELFIFLLDLGTQDTVLRSYPPRYHIAVDNFNMLSSECIASVLPTNFNA